MDVTEIRSVPRDVRDLGSERDLDRLSARHKFESQVMEGYDGPGEDRVVFTRQLT